MNKLWVVAKNELIRYFTSPLAYVYLLAFLLLNGSFAIYFGHFFDRGNADLSAMFAFQPWLYLLFIPGIAMRLWAEEFRNKTVVQLVTMPVSIPELVWGKFVASWMFCALALVLTMPFWVTVNVLGEPDNAVIAAGYGASLVLAGCMLAVSQTMSALTKNQVVALVLAVVANLLFFWSGLEYVLAFFRLFAPVSVIDMIASFSFLTHFGTMSAGVLELRDVVFFASLIILFNFTTVLVVSFKTSGSSELLQSGRKAYYVWVFVILLIGFAGLNLAANRWMRQLRYDFTQEQIYTLNQDTVALLQGLKHPVVAKLYYSKILEQRNPMFRQVFDKARVLLAQMAEASNGKFSYRIYHPEVLSNEEDQAMAAGLQPLPVVDENISAFLGLVLVNELDEHAVIPFLVPERANSLEQDVAEKLLSLREDKKTVGVLTSLSMFDTMQSATMVSQKWEILNKIGEEFSVKKIEKPEEIDGVDVLMIVQPQGWAPEMVAKVRQYANNGGKILLFADVAPEASRLYSAQNNDLLAADLYGLDEEWGFKFHPETVVADLANSLLVDITNSNTGNPLFTQDVLQFVLGDEQLTRTLPEVANLRGVLLASASVVTKLSQRRDILFLPLIRAGEQSQLMPAVAAQRSINPAILLQKFKPDAVEKTIAAKIVSLDEKKPFKIIAVADTDLLYDDFWANKTVVAGKEYVVPLVDNANFVMNALESLLESDNIMELRGKSVLDRPFRKVEELRRKSLQEFRLKEAEIFKRIEEAKQALQDVWNKKSFEERENFSSDELAVIAGIRKRLESLKAELSDIRANANTELNKVDWAVKAVNIYAVPLLIALLLLLVALKGRKKETVLEKIKLNRQVVRIMVTAAMLLALGIAAATTQYGDAQEKYENQPVFDDLAEQINQIDRIVIKNHEAEIKLYKQEGLWRLDNPADVPVYQARVRSFLSALLEARFFEKKTADAAYLARFDLNPIEEAGSKNTRIELQNDDGKEIAAFEVGKYDLDVGRGERAAYVKFDNQFQVWLVLVDLIDIEPMWQNWTYDTLWNLRYGRLQGFDDVAEEDRIAEMMKVLLNTYLLACGEPQNAEPLFEMRLKAEGGVEVELSFVSAEGKTWVKYDFVNTNDNKHLQMFAEYAKSRFYEIAADDLKRMINVIKRRKS